MESYKKLMLMAALSQAIMPIQVKSREEVAELYGPAKPAHLDMPVHPYTHKKSKGDKKRSRAERRRGRK